eukprot:gnl/TRDRNA2_/TRDRNA2_173990_c3_seq11.p1 gnl/TRDRNA2_/TRDRNA2_173990_c3~~gnl/TRDRNA2_/TRDRNA2_173990_c3_seq11.p1  ORF type:complete len:561 (+),score=168.52 gnl/TRDRNA2_/TRDRNA2_173990_c3_seq11:93-1775(+)
MMLTARPFLIAALLAASALGRNDDDTPNDNNSADTLAAPNGTVMFSASNSSLDAASNSTAAAAVDDPAVDTSSMNSSTAFETAAEAANVANSVATHSIHITQHAQTALKRARDTIRDARANTKGLNKAQRELLRTAESQLRDATQAAEYGKLKQAKYMSAQGHWDTKVITDKDTRVSKVETEMEDRMIKQQAETKQVSEVETMRKELETMRTEMETKRASASARGNKVSYGTTSDAQMEQEVQSLESMMTDLEEEEKQSGTVSVSTDEMKAEVERLRETVEHAEEVEQEQEQVKVSTKLAKMKTLKKTREDIAEVEAMMKDEDNEQVEHELDVLRKKEKTLEEDIGPDSAELEVKIAETEREAGAATVDLPRKTSTLPPTGSLEYNMRESREPEEASYEVTQHIDGEEPAEASYEVSRESGDSPDFQKVYTRSSDDQQQVHETTSSGIDIDTEMPYGELEPFGREDTAQELTESSIRESDEMVDQLERAEVAEEKRSVFRALTRLRGAAITSFDGVARAQTGNIDEYNKIHKWRKTHPLHHLADEESDITKWAFPDNADF